MTKTYPKAGKDFLQNDKFLVCSMLAFYGLCIVGLIAGTFIWLGNRAETIKVNATATEAAITTERANASATIVAHIAEQAQYEFIDRFNEDNDWLVSSYDNNYFVGRSTISEGIYKWEIDRVDKTFVYWADYKRGLNIFDFDMYVDTKINDDNPGNVCSGIALRKPSHTWAGGSYIFSVCNDSYFDIYYHKEDNWESLSGETYSNVIKPNDWNRLEVKAQGSHFIFIINNVVVFEMTDDRQPYGRLALYIEVGKKEPVSIWFDNFGYQSR